MLYPFRAPTTKFDSSTGPGSFTPYNCTQLLATVAGGKLYWKSRISAGRVNRCRRNVQGCRAISHTAPIGRRPTPISAWNRVAQISTEDPHEEIASVPSCRTCHLGSCRNVVFGTLRRHHADQCSHFQRLPVQQF